MVTCYSWPVMSAFHLWAGYKRFFLNKSYVSTMLGFALLLPVCTKSSSMGAIGSSTPACPGVSLPACPAHPLLLPRGGTHLCPGLLVLRRAADHSVHAAQAGRLQPALSWGHLHLAVGQMGLCPQAVDPVDPEGILLCQVLQPGRQGSLKVGRG